MCIRDRVNLCVRKKDCAPFIWSSNVYFFCGCVQNASGKPTFILYTWSSACFGFWQWSHWLRKQPGCLWCIHFEGDLPFCLLHDTPNKLYSCRLKLNKIWFLVSYDRPVQKNWHNCWKRRKFITLHQWISDTSLLYFISHKAFLSIRSGVYNWNSGNVIPISGLKS